MQNPQEAEEKLSSLDDYFEKYDDIQKQLENEGRWIN